MTDIDLQILKASVDKVVTLQFADGETAIAKVLLVSDEDMDVIYDLVSIDTSQAVNAGEPKPALLARWDEISSIVPMKDALVEYVRDNRRVCPKPDKWNELWELLPGRHRVGSGWDPPLPLILAAWWHTSALEKMLRLDEHIQYADKSGILPIVDRFLRQLSERDWAHLGDC